MRNPTRLSKKSPEDWADDIAKLPEHIQPTIGSTIWWDYFAEVKAKKTDAFNQWIEAFSGMKCKTAARPDKAELRTGLVMIGYTKSEAVKRYMDHREK